MDFLTYGYIETQEGLEIKSRYQEYIGKWQNTIDSEGTEPEQLLGTGSI